MSVMSSSQLFKVVRTDAAARTGCLRLPGFSAIETPAVLVQTRKGSAVNLTHDLTESLPHGAALALNALNFTNAPAAAVLHLHGGGARGFLGHPTLPLVATARDALEYEFPGLSNRDSGTIVRSSYGNVEVTPSAYHDIIEALRPDVCVSLADDVPASAGKNRVSVSVRRTAQWLQAFLAARQPQTAAASATALPPPLTGANQASTSAAGTAKTSAVAQEPTAVGLDRRTAGSAAETSNSSGCGGHDVPLKPASRTEAQPSVLASIPLLAAVVGGKWPRQRVRSAQLAAATPGVAGFALTGFGTGETQQQMMDALQAAIGELPALLPRLAQGVSYPAAVVAAVGAGVDLFDAGFASIATAAGLALTFEFQPPIATSSCSGTTDADFRHPSAAVDLKDRRHRLDASPLLVGCGCSTCKLHSRAYIHHLINTNEMLSLTLLDVHNHFHIIAFFEEIRRAISLGRFRDFASWISYSTGDMGLQGGPIPKAAAGLNED